MGILSRSWRLSSTHMMGWLNCPIQRGYRWCSMSSQNSLTGLVYPKHLEDGENGLLDLLHPWRIVRDSIHDASDGGCDLVLRDTTTEGGVPRFWCRYDRGFHDETSPLKSLRRQGDPLASSPPPSTTPVGKIQVY